MEDRAVYFICADDDFLATNRGREIYEELCIGIEDDMSKEVIEAYSGKVDEALSACAKLYEAAATLSLFGGRKVVWFKNMNFVNDSRAGNSQDVKDQLEKLSQYLSGLDRSVVSVVITASPIDRRKKFYKELQKFSVFEDYAQKDPHSACIKFINIQARNLGIKFAPNAVETLVSLVGASPRMAMQEMKKLATYLNFEKEITQELVLNMVSIFGNTDFNSITEAFYRGTLAEALDALNRYFFTDKSASGRRIVMDLQRQNTLLIQIKALIENSDFSTSGANAGVLSRVKEKYADIFAYSGFKTPYNIFSQHPWLIGTKLPPLANRISLKKLIDYQMLLIDTFRAFNLPSANEKSLVEDLFIKARGK